MDKNNLENNITDKTSKLSKLEDWYPQELNEFALTITKFFKKQTPYNSKEPFTDPLFPPNENSLMGTKDFKGNSLDDVIKEKGKKVPIVKEDLPDLDSIVWLRANEIFEGKKYAVFESSVSESDLIQGNIGDCYFISALAAMCKNPQLLMQLFRTPFTTENSYYEVIMRINGVWKVVILDDYFPCDKNTKKPIFAKPSGNELWAMLLEKAWAKINGGYRHITGGFSHEVWECLTNLPCFKYSIDEEEDGFLYNLLKFPRPERGQANNNKKISSNEIKNRFWKKLLQFAEEKAYMYSASKKEDNGIVSSHAYTLLDAKERKIAGELIKLVKLRNPWGCGEWQGDWSDKSTKWTEESRKAFEQNEFSNDGCFYMPYLSFLEYFKSISVISNVFDPICSRSITTPKPDAMYKCYVLDLDLPKKSKINISLFKKSFRFNKKIDKLAENEMAVSVACKSSANTTLLQYEEIMNNNLHLQTELEIGNYLIFIDCCYGRSLYHSENDFCAYDKFRKITLDVSANNFFNLTYIGIDSTKAQGTLRQKSNITPLFFKKKYLFNPVKPKEPINSGYKFIGRNIKFKKNPYIVCLDPYLQAVRYYTQKYPREMYYLNTLEKIKKRDNSVRPSDRAFVLERISEYEFYLGESSSNSFEMNGPGLISYSQDGLCFGYFTNNKRNGLFTYVDKDIKRCINFKNNEPEGEAFIYIMDKLERKEEVLMEYKILGGKLVGKNLSGKDIEIPNSNDGLDHLWSKPDYYGYNASTVPEDLAEIEKIDLDDEEDVEDIE